MAQWRSGAVAQWRSGAVAQWLGLMSLLLAGCAELDDGVDLGSASVALASEAQPRDDASDAWRALPGVLPDISLAWGCTDELCGSVEVEHEVVRSGTAPDSGHEPYDNVRTQRERLEEFRALTERTLALQPADCDVDPSRYAEDRVAVTIMLEEQPFDFRRYRSAAADRRAMDALNEERSAQVRPDQNRIGALVERQGGRFMGGGLLVNIVDAELPVCGLREAASWPGVVTIEELGESEPAVGVHGIERREALGLPSLLLGPPFGGLFGLDGSQGSWRSGGTRLRFGVIEADSSLNTSHLSFRDGVGTASRVVDTDRCTFWFPSIRCINSATTTSSTHGTRVTSVLLGDLHDGQDPAISNVTERNRRSGVAPEGTVHYYSALYYSGERTAVEEATTQDGVDVINMSLSPRIEVDGTCDNASHNGVREAIEAATDAGVLVVVSAANYGLVPGCNISNYGAFPDTLTVGGTNVAASRAALDTVARHPESSWGHVGVSLRGGRAVQTRMVDVVTNHVHSHVAGGGQDGYVAVGGTSFSSPTIAGLAGLLYHWAYNRGGLSGAEDDPYVYRLLLSLMADGRVHPASEARWHVDPSMGFGNVRFVDLDAGLGANGGWGFRRTTMLPGSVHLWSVGGAGPESTTLNGWKFVALIDHNRYGGGPDLTFELVDLCPAGGFGEVVLATATHHALKARMRISANQLDTHLRGRCLWMRTTVNEAAGPVTVYTADMYYSNTRLHHDATIF